MEAYLLILLVVCTQEYPKLLIIVPIKKNIDKKKIIAVLYPVSDMGNVIVKFFVSFCELWFTDVVGFHIVMRGLRCVWC